MALDQGAAAPSPELPVGTFLLFAAACLLYLLGIVGLLGGSSGDPAGRGIEQAFTILDGVLLWLLLAAMMIVAAHKGEMPAWAIPTVAVLVPASAFAAEFAADVYWSTLGLSYLVPMLLPPAIAFYALWARCVWLHRAWRPGIINMVSLTTILGLTVAAVPLAAFDEGTYPNRAEARRQRNQALMEENDRAFKQAEAESAERLRRLTPDNSLRDYMPYLSVGEYHADPEVITRAAQVKSRQADAVALLKEGKSARLQDLWQLDLEATPALCAAYASSLRAQSAEYPSDSDYYVFEPALKPQLPNIRWLVGQHCNIDAAVAELEQQARAFGNSVNSPSLKQFADDLAQLHQLR